MKKRYILNMAGEQHTAVVGRQAGQVCVEIDECGHEDIDAAPVLAGRALSLRIGGRMHLLHITGTDNKGELAMTVRGRPVSLAVLDELRALALQSLDIAAGSDTITTDIPGLVVDIRVKPGQKVHQGEPIVVVEAMKMQNELSATVSGTVAEINITTGQTVNPGEPLIVITPEPGG